MYVQTVIPYSWPTLRNVLTTCSLEPNQAASVCRLEEVEDLIKEHNVCDCTNQYLESQVWVDEPREVHRATDP